MKLITIVIPVYKCEAFISKCIESILEQTYKDYELILVDDGSPDKSGSICDYYSTIDNRIKVFHISNGGPSVARNYGLQQATGHFVTFIDSDDWIEPTYLQNLLNGWHKIGDGVVIAGHIREGKNVIAKKHNDSIFYKIDFAIMCDKMRIFNWGYSHDKLYSLDVIKKNNIQFPINIKFSEDLIFLLNYLLFCDWARFITNTDYHYIQPQNQKSLISSYNSFNSEYLCYKITRECFDKIEQISSPEKIASLYLSRSWASYMFFRAIKTQYRRGKNYLCHADRIKNLKYNINSHDISFAKRYSFNNSFLDKAIILLLSIGWFQFIDLLLIFIFYLRYSRLGLIMKS